MADGGRLSIVFRRLIDVLKGSATDVMIRTYEESGGHPESGTPPSLTPIDTPILPRPIVLDATYKSDVLGERITDAVRIEAGDKKIVMDAGQDVSVGCILHFAGEDFRIFRLSEPVLFGSVQVKVAYARKVQR